MKLNWSFFINTALTITLFTSATLSVRGKQVTDYAQDYTKKSHSEVIAAPVVNPDREDNLVESLNQGFSAKQTIGKELAFAILIIVVCQLVKYSSKSVEQAISGVPNKLKHRYMFVGLGYFYQSINSQREAIEKPKEKVKSNKK